MKFVDVDKCKNALSKWKEVERKIILCLHRMNSYAIIIFVGAVNKYRGIVQR